MKFAHPWILYLIPAVLLLLGCLIYLGERRRRKLTQLFTGDPSRLWSSPGFSRSRKTAGIVALLGAVISLMVALARPMVYSKDKITELQGISYIVAVDASRSMLATDVRPSRYGAASNALDRWLGEVKADRVGLVTFAGDAYLNAPITFDTMALRTVLRFIEPDDIFEGGSSLAKSIERTAKYFASNDVPQRVMIIISDGEQLEDDAIEAARLARQKDKMVISTIGVGTSTGSKVPANRKGGAWGNAKNAFGQEVTTRLDEATLKRVANAGGGRYYPLGQNGEGLDLLRNEVLRPLAEAAAMDNLQNYRDVYQIPLAFSLAFLILAILIQGEVFQVRKTPNQAIFKI